MDKLYIQGEGMGGEWRSINICSLRNQNGQNERRPDLPPCSLPVFLESQKQTR